MDEDPEAGALAAYLASGADPAARSAEWRAARRLAAHASSAATAAAVTALLSVFALLTQTRHIIPTVRSPVLALGCTLLAMLVGVASLVLAALDLSWAARMDRPGAALGAMRRALAGLLAAGIPVLGGSALLAWHWSQGADVRAPMAALALPILFVASGAALGVVWILGARTFAACRLEPAAHPEPRLWELRATANRGCLIAFGFALLVAALTGLLAMA